LLDASFENVSHTLSSMLARWQHTGKCAPTQKEAALFLHWHHEVTNLIPSWERTDSQDAIAELASCPHSALKCLQALYSNPWADTPDLNGLLGSLIEARLSNAPIVIETPDDLATLADMATGIQNPDYVIFLRAWRAISPT
jgi:hypothetical protein